MGFYIIFHLSTYSILVEFFQFVINLFIFSNISIAILG